MKKTVPENVKNVAIFYLQMSIASAAAIGTSEVWKRPREKWLVSTIIFKSILFPYFLWESFDR